MMMKIFFRLNIFEKFRLFMDRMTVKNIFEVLNGENIPESNSYCKFCNYYFSIKNKINE